jgi:hypothetical protein
MIGSHHHCRVLLTDSGAVHIPGKMENPQIPHHAREPDLHDCRRDAGADDIDGDAPWSGE